MSKWNKRSIIMVTALFIGLPLLLAVIMIGRSRSLLDAHAERHVSAQGEILTQLASQKLSNRQAEMERVAGYFRDGIVAEERMGSVSGRLLSTPSQSSLGVVRLGGEAVSGETLPPSEYPAVLNAFRGKSTVRYRGNEGLLFTAPIYNGENIKYVLYLFCNESLLFSGFGKESFEGRAQYFLADNAQQIFAPLSGGSGTGDVIDLQDELGTAATELFRGRELNSGVDTVSCEVDGERMILFFSELEQPNLYLMGAVPYEVASDEVTSIFRTIMLVFALLLILLAIGTVRIVTADAKARESDELREAKQVAEEAYASKSRFLASMSHELRTPINTIMGMNEMILRESRETDTRERAMDVKSASQILLGLINDILDFSKIESGMLNILPVEYHLSALIQDLSLLTENRARSKSLEFKMDIQPDLPEGLLGDDMRIQQILTNLLTNAVKYTKQGNVTLRMSGTRKDKDTLILHCAVEDTGIGLKPEDIEKLMRLTPYTRVDEQRNRKVEGSGLGLPIIINLLKLMNSELKVESVYGKGSTFWFDLEQRVVDEEPIGDIYARMESKAKDYEYRVTCYAPKARVLVVDDNSMNRKIFGYLLKSTKIQVTAASSGAKCLELVQKEHFDLIFMDHLMPEMDGVETLQRLKALENNLCKDTPVIALTANAFSGAQEKYMAMGFDAFLSKPIVTEKLEGMLLGMLPPEYLETPPEQSGQPAAASVEEEVELPEIEGVNWDFALLHINDKRLIWSTAEDFYESLDGEERELTALAGNVDSGEGLAAYRTRVHALKSTAAMVGILSVSELARLLEYAARAGEAEKIRTLNPILLELLQTTRERLSPFMQKDDGERPMADLPKVAPLLEMLRASMEDMDITTADAVVDQLERFSYEEELQANMDEMSRLVAALDFDGARELIDRVLAVPMEEEE